MSAATSPATAAAAPAATPMLPPDAVEVGRVVGAWGIQGGIKVKPFAAEPQALFATKRWFLQPPATPRPQGARPVDLPLLLRIVQAREQGEWIVATAQELPDRNAAEALAGARVFVSRASFPTPSEDEFYWVDLIGLAVHNRTGLRLGEVVGLVETGPHCVLRVRSAPDADELLIPFVAAYVDGVDLPGRRLSVDWEADY